ncbi:MAG: glycerophosphodiester phosphodiesterase [Candidatus Omnitrophota bacterium]
MRRIKHTVLKLSFMGMVFFSAICCYSGKAKCLIIAHRGASGYLPEHTLEAKAMAHALGADYLEQDVVLTKDNQPVILHDIYLDEVSDVAQTFPGRNRPDGRYYVIDFTLAEIKSLNLTERFDRMKKEVIYSKRFPIDTGIAFKIPTLEEEIKFIQGLNRSTGRNVGIYVELKSPRFHRREGKEMTPIVLDTLEKYGYKDRHSDCYLQCFDPMELRDLKNKYKSDLKRVQLIAIEEDKIDGIKSQEFAEMFTRDGLRKIKEYADAIGPHKEGLWEKDKDFKAKYKNFVKNAHALGLKVHPYTFRSDELPPYVKRFDELLRIFINEFGVDGIFTDFPDKVSHRSSPRT